MTWIQVDSVMLSEVCYNEKEQQFDARFRKGNNGQEFYRYFGVPRETFDELLAAESKGQFMQANIIYHFRHERVDNSMKTFTAEYKCEVTKHYVILAASLEEAYDKAKIFDVEDDGVEVDMEEWELNDVTERRE